jgi:hypothetical protein
MTADASARADAAVRKAKALAERAAEAAAANFSSRADHALDDSSPLTPAAAALFSAADEAEAAVRLDARWDLGNTFFVLAAEAAVGYREFQRERVGVGDAGRGRARPFMRSRYHPCRPIHAWMPFITAAPLDWVALHNMSKHAKPVAAVYDDDTPAVAAVSSRSVAPESHISDRGNGNGNFGQSPTSPPPVFRSWRSLQRQWISEANANLTAGFAATDPEHPASARAWLASQYGHPGGPRVGIFHSDYFPAAYMGHLPAHAWQLSGGRAGGEGGEAAVDAAFASAAPVRYAFPFEPYYIFKPPAPRFDEAYRGRGKNKSGYWMSLALTGRAGVLSGGAEPVGHMNDSHEPPLLFFPAPHRRPRPCSLCPGCLPLVRHGARRSL